MSRRAASVNSRWPTPRRYSLARDGPSRARAGTGRSSASGRIHDVSVDRSHSHRNEPTASVLMGSDICDSEVIAGDEIQDIQNLSEMNETIMALDLQDRSTLGCAFFNTVDGNLFLAEDAPLATMEIVEQLLVQVEPTTVLVSGRAPEILIDFLQGWHRSKDTSGLSSTFILRTLPSSEFLETASRERLLGLKLDAEPLASALMTAVTDDLHVVREGTARPEGRVDEESRNTQLIRCGTMVELESHASVSCAGAVLADLHRRRSISFLPNGQSAELVFHVQRLKTFSLSQYMQISSEALQSLQILKAESHPNGQSWGSESGGTKESLSVYGLFHVLTYTPQGRNALRQMFLRPSLSLEVIQERQNTICLFLRPDNVDTVKQICSILRRVKNVRTAISQLQKGTNLASSAQSFHSGVWAIIKAFTAQALRLRETIADITRGEKISIIQETVKVLQRTSLLVVGNCIDKTIDFEQSKARYRPSVRTGIDPRLDELKRRYDGMGSFLTEVVNHLSQSLPEWARQYIRSCIFLPQLGFLTVVEPDPDTGIGKYEGENSISGPWEKLFTTDGAVCYKNTFMKELDKQYGDMYCEIGDREVEIITDLAKDVLLHREAMIAASDLCGKLDALMALAKGAQKYDLVCPRLVKSDALHIQSGRHPLQELVVPVFVPNDCYLGSGDISDDGAEKNYSNSMILTGSFVPAAEATIGLTDKILTRVTTRETMSSGESAFAIDMKQMAQAMKRATPHSLVIVDEFGKGTNTDDGAGLLAAAIDYFKSLESNCPRLIVATHFHELFEQGYLKACPKLELAYMDARTSRESNDPRDQITYLFKLCRGQNESSFGSICAALNGVPTTIVERAEGIAQLLARNEDLIFACAKLTDDEEKGLEDAETAAREFVQRDFDDPESAHTLNNVLGKLTKERHSLYAGSPKI